MIVNWKTTNAADYWKAERMILRATGVQSAVHLWTALEGSFSSPIAIYSADAGGNLDIDVTDYLRTYGAQTFKVAESSLNVYSVAVTIRGLINPKELVIPECPLVQYAYWQEHMLIAPPVFNYAALSGSSIKVGLYIDEERNGDYSFDDGDTPYISNGKYGLDYQDREDPREDAVGIVVRNVTPLGCGVEYCMVSWESPTGRMYRHTFEFVKSKEDVGDSYSLLNLNNEYEEIRGRVEGGTIRLPNLCRYDMWYYSQIICSSKVTISFDGVTEYRAQVTTKSSTMPDGENGNRTLEINLNWRKYDATSMQ